MAGASEHSMWDVLVIGSGYAGSVIAARLAPRCRLLVAERGRRWQSGEFPEGVVDLARNYYSQRSPAGLWAVRLGEGTGTAFASALGGSSAVNYGITSRPDDHVFADWPISAAELAPYFDRSRQVLRPEPNPIAHQLGDQAFLDLVEPGRRVDLENTIDWERCTQCGRCVPGCNHGAKRTLAETYLATATTAGAEIRTSTEVRSIEPIDGGGYAVELRDTGTGETAWMKARRVVLAAGTLGTLDLVWRMRDRIPAGPMLGKRMSLNGDGLAFLYDTPHALSSHSGAPISTSVRIPFAAADGTTRTLMVMSGRVPMAAMRFAGAALALLSGTVGEPRARATSGAWLRRLRDLAGVDARGALSRSFMYKLDAQDEAKGQARFTPHGTVIDWPGYADDPILVFAEQRLRAWAARVGGRVVPNIARLPGMRSFSVHPLGGCRMGTSVDDAVVDTFGRWLDPRGGLHPGLRIVDGSILPGSLGVPPSWTIAALAERVADDMLSELATE